MNVYFLKVSWNTPILFQQRLHRFVELVTYFRRIPRQLLQFTDIASAFRSAVKTVLRMIRFHVSFERHQFQFPDKSTAQKPSDRSQRPSNRVFLQRS